MSHLSSLFAFAVMPMLSLGATRAEVKLAALRHTYRPLLIFAAAADENLRQQMQLLAQQKQEIEARQILVIPVLLDQSTEGKEDKSWSGDLPEADLAEMNTAEAEAARRRFHNGRNDFTVILVGKDGGEKLRSRTPVTMERLIKLIDSMPTRQKEFRDGHSG
jgi:hypothetical protein